MPKHKKVFQPAPRKRCGGKICYPHKSEAETVKIEQEILQTDLRLTLYRCAMCRNWHLAKSVS